MTKLVEDIIKQIGMTQTRRALWRIIADFYKGEGFDKLSYHDFYSDGAPRTPVAEGFPAEWVRHYIDDHLDLVDPMPMLASQRVAPFWWREAQDLSDLSDARKEFLLETRLAGIGDGLAMAVFGPNLRNAYVALGFGDDVDEPTDAQIMSYHMVAQVGHLRFCALSDAIPSDGAKLSSREREVLDLIAEGKSNTVIGDILAISKHTVDAHLRGIYLKLGVNDRTSAALLGVQRGYLHFPLRK